MEEKTETPVQVQSINDYVLGPAIAERYGLWGPLKGERLLQFFEHIVEAHDRYVEALTDPVRVLRDIYRPPTTDEHYQRCWDAAVQLFTEHKSLDKVLDVLDMTMNTLRHSLAPRLSQGDTNGKSKLDKATWLKVEQIIVNDPDVRQDDLILATGVSKDDIRALRELYGTQASRSNRIGAPKMPAPAHERMLELIRDGKHGTEIGAVLKREFDITISRSLVTKTRKRLTERGLL